MDPQSDLPDLVEDLEVNIDELSTALEPLLSTPLHTTASSLPLLDKAKLYVLAAYSIESLVFSTLQASGVNAKEHAIFKELARLKSYFGKIKDIEERGAPPPKARLDVAAAQRFIKHGLAGNERYDLERAERVAKEKARAAVKAAMLHKRFDDAEEEKLAGAVTPKKRGADDVSAAEEAMSDADSANDAVAALEGALASPTPKKPRLASSSPSAMDTDSAPASSTTAKKTRRKKHNKAKKANNNTDAPDTKTQRPRKKQGIKKLDPAGHSDNEESILPERVLQDVPKTRSEMFNALLDGSLAEKSKGKKGKGRGK